jgi:hypothetical protein
MKKTAHKIAAVCFLILMPGHGMAKTRSTTGFNCFHVQNPTMAPKAYHCLTEDNGAVVNNCAVPISLAFNLPIDSVGTKTVTVTDYWNSPDRFKHFNCGIYDQAGLSGISNNFVSVSFTRAKQTLQGSVLVSNASNDGFSFLNAVSLICFEVPPGEGIANINWAY